jgi:hypothetical protein
MTHKIIILLFILVCLVSPATSSDYHDPARELIELHDLYSPLNPFQSPPNPFKPTEIEWPEYYIDPAVDYGLSLILPAAVNKRITVDTWYDRWEGRPTITTDMFMQFWRRERQSFFVCPSAALRGNTERLSLEAGYRRLLGSKAMFGLVAFHDRQRIRGSDGTFIAQTGAGLELSVLPGHYSDILIKGNVYIPSDERTRLTEAGRVLVKERLAGGVDVKTDVRLPALINGLDISFRGEYRRFGADASSRYAYDLGLAASSQDGLASVGFDWSRNKSGSRVAKVHANISVAFSFDDLFSDGDWRRPAGNAGALPWERDLKQELDKRVDRRRDHSVTRSKRRISLAARVIGNGVRFGGEFPGLNNGTLTVQTAQSPWKDVTNIRTNGKGYYSGTIMLPEGLYKLRLIHKPTGRATPARRVEIR